MSHAPAIETIRAATRRAHSELESTLDVGRGAAEYQRFAEALFGWVAPIETRVWAGTWPADLDVRARQSKRTWLETDLRAAGHDDASIAALPRLDVPAGLDDQARRVGVAYVMEGSQLGARVLKARLDGRLGAIPGRWLDGYGARTGELWSTFVGHLNRSLATRDAAQRAGDAAAETFDRLAGWMRDRGATQ